MFNDTFPKSKKTFGEMKTSDQWIPIARQCTCDMYYIYVYCMYMYHSWKLAPCKKTTHLLFSFLKKVLVLCSFPFVLKRINFLDRSFVFLSSIRYNLSETDIIYDIIGNR